MSVTFSFLPDEPTGSAVRRIEVELLDSIRSNLESLDADRDEHIHDARQQLKKLRGLLRLARGGLDPATYERENACFRDVGRTLAGAREAAAALECVDTLLEHYSGEIPREEFFAVEQVLSTISGATLSQAAESLVFSQAIAELELAKQRIVDGPLLANDFDSIAPGLFGIYRQARRALRRASREPSSEHFHELRKLSKYHMHHVRLLEPAFPIELHARRKALDELNDALGHLHDLDVLRHMLENAELRAAPRLQLLALTALVDRRRRELEIDAELQALRLYAEKPQALLKRVRRYFELWRSSTPLEAGPHAPEGGTSPSAAASAPDQARRSINA